MAVVQIWRLCWVNDKYVNVCYMYMYMIKAHRGMVCQGLFNVFSISYPFAMSRIY